ncbi:MAG TPA: hypothetical protein VFA18_20330 [Gemmataceae bacterium]|nr:hypothetical protein [Gemmataceae bacterium]
MIRAESQSTVARWIIGFATVGMLLIMVMTAAQKLGETLRYMGQGTTISQPRPDTRRPLHQPVRLPEDTRLTAVVRS